MRCQISILLGLLFSILGSSQNVKEKADQFFALGNYTKAIETYKSLDDLEEAYSKIAKSYVAIGNFGEGLTYYEKAVEANPDNVLIKYEYAKLLRRTKKYSDAKQLLEKLIVTDSLNPNFHYELGLVLEKQNDSTSIKTFMKTFGLDFTHQKAIFKIAKHSIKKRKFKLAHRFIDKGLESYSENVELISLKAQAYYFQEHYTHAVVWFKKLLDLGEKSEFIHEKLSLSYAQNHDYEEAIFHRKAALKYNPNDANALFVIGKYYEQLDNFEKAETYYKKSLLLRDVSLSNEYQKLGVVLNRQQKHQEAIKAFQKAQKEDPSDIMNEFFIIRTKDEYYADVDAKIKLYEDYIKKDTKSPFKVFAERRLKELKEEKFLEKE
ncbi:tetratricopeptide repeat protein [Winogradskyella sp.]|jgi:tetratricopeptide (TPR) repeat protein|uniref:tetratricopeptide repeat protein n=1 Tax=Winogradskyella sp. TaxID=1883156 RepID=UPI0025DB28DA|nr:tetratricopeptide repeat protein [Winogradskyella sp.]MCT4630133.1 tetratricopeptide repeat protein [Winogradskyella sp.]